MARQSRRQLKPIKELSPRQQRERRIARSLGMKDEYQLRRWVKLHRSLPENDPRYLGPEIRGLNPTEFKRLRQVSKRYKTPADRLIQKKAILVDGDASVHFSAFAFEERYREQIRALLQDSSTTAYQKRKLRNLERELQRNIHRGDIGIPRQFDFEGRYHGSAYQDERDSEG